MALAETAGNRAIGNARITAISMKLKDSGSREIKYTEFRMIIESLDRKFEFMTGEDDRFINLLRTVYGAGYTCRLVILNLAVQRLNFLI